MKKRNNLKVKPTLSNFNTFEESKRHPCIYVEGRNDYIVYYEVINNGWNIFYDPNSDKFSSSKKKVIEAVDKRKKNNFSNKGFIGIIDKDYDEVVQIDHIYYTDYNDLECTAINYLEIRDIYNYLLIRDKISFNDFEIIFNSTLTISKEFSSLWEFINYNNTYRGSACPYMLNIYRRNEVAFFNMVINRNNMIKYDVLLELYKEKNRLFKDFSLDEFISVMKIENKNSFRGHDFFSILSYILNKQGIISTYDIFKFEEHFLQRANQKEWIKNTNLYQEIKPTGIFK